MLTQRPGPRQSVQDIIDGQVCAIGCPGVIESVAAVFNHYLCALLQGSTALE